MSDSSAARTLNLCHGELAGLARDCRWPQKSLENDPGDHLTFRLLDTSILPHSTLAELYRFAWLLTGEAPAAEAALSAALVDVEPHLEGLRSPAQRHAWLAHRIRQSCLKSAPPAADATAEPAPRLLREESLEPIEILEIEAYIVAQRVRALPEPDRSALALFYLELLSPAESAKVLSVSLEEYCGLLGRARMQMHRQMRALHSTALPVA